MAKNTKYFYSLAVWKKYFYDWVNTVSPQDLIDVSIFYDFRSVYGDPSLTTDLRSYLNKLLQGKNLFLYHLAQNAIQLKPPIGFFGNILAETAGEHSEAFNIKTAIMPIQSFARIYALQNGVVISNTIERLNQLNNMNVLSSSTYETIMEAYNYLMLMRFKHQSAALSNNKKLHNYISVKELSDIEQTMLKKIFSQISSFQSKLKVDFTGSM